MKRALLLLAVTFSTTSVFAHGVSVYCNAFEACPVKGTDRKKVQKECNKLMEETVPVYQMQEDGETKLIGYTCMQFSGN